MHGTQLEEHWEQGNETPIIKHVPYREIIGGLLYACQTRPDIVYIVHRLARFSSRPTPLAWKAAKRVLIYLKTTKNLRLTYKHEESSTLSSYCDSDWAGESYDRKSVDGYFILMGNDVIDWSSKKQTGVSQSSTEAEFIGASRLSRNIMVMKNLCNDLKIIHNYSIMMNIDNQSALSLVKAESTKRRLKHIDIKYKYVRDLYNKNVIDVCYVKSADNKADILTKCVSRDTFERIRRLLNIK